MKNFHKASLVATALVAAAGGLLAAAPIGLSPAASSRLWLEGDSTLHPYTIEATRLQLDMRLEKGEGGALAEAARAPKAVKLSLSIPVAAMKSDHSGLDKNMRKAMKADEHPDIVFVLDDYAVSAGKEESKVAASGMLTIAGVSKVVTLNATMAEKDERLIVEGEQLLLMSDYGIKPPRLMLGAVKTADKVVVKYRLQLEPEGGPTVTQRLVDGVYFVDGAFALRTSSAVAWAVLSDYDRIADFVSSMRHSAVKERRPGSLLVEQEALGKAFFISKKVRVLLEVRETPPRSIEFKDIASTDFDLYQGSWTLEADGDELRVRYHLEAKPRMKAPGFVGRHAFKANTSRLLAEVRAEILRRTPLATMLRREEASWM